MTVPARHATHAVANQVPPLTGHDVAADQALTEALAREGASWSLAELHELGLLAGSAVTAEQARLANVSRPVLRTHDSRGHRVDEVDFHPAWHQLMTTAVEHGLHAAPWADARPGAHVARAAKFMVWSQAEAGHGCPISMTYSCVPALRRALDLAAVYEPLLTARHYDPGLRAPQTKAGLLAGMAMTEKQGGSDVRANTTIACPAGDGSYLLTGHKWFCSAPMSDLFLVLARADAGLSCFLLPRILPDGERNGLRIQRLKDKLGNTSNASAEVEFDQAIAWPVGEPGRGIPTIIEMVTATRLDCILGSSAAIRQATVTAHDYARRREAFGRPLIDQPAMTGVIADLTIESEASTALAIRLAAAADRAASGNEAEAALLRLALPAAKYWICKRTPMIVSEALECLGGNGYVEDFSPMPRLLRDSPLNSIWEGSGNVTALDVLRALRRSPDSADVLLAEVGQAAGDPAADAAAVALRQRLTEAGPDADRPDERQARALAAGIAIALQASLLARYAPAPLWDAFSATRLSAGPATGMAGPGVPFGSLPGGLDLAAVVSRSAVTAG